MKIKLLFLFIGLLLTSKVYCLYQKKNINSSPLYSNTWINQKIATIIAKKPNINKIVLKTALIAYKNARNMGLDKKQILTVIDYSKPSTDKRLWVLDVKNEKILLNTWVSHGKNSGYIKAYSFSNQLGSLKSSFGVFLTTSHPYFGSKGYSLRIEGLEPGINDNAYKRYIVFHGSHYVGLGKTGRSFGCPAINVKQISYLINVIKEHTLVVAYYPNQNWLTHSKFLI